MRGRILSAWAVAVGVAATAGGAAAGPISLVDPNTLATVRRVAFDEGPFLDALSNPRALNKDGEFRVGRVAFGERFAGQALGSRTAFDDELFDTAGGRPTGPLKLVAGAAGHNVAIAADVDGSEDDPQWFWAVAGLGPVGFGDGTDQDRVARAIGEGTLAVLFDADQSALAFGLYGGNADTDPGGKATVRFFRRDGSFIDTFEFADSTRQFRGFSRAGGVADVAGFLIENDDEGGVGINDLRFDPTLVPTDPPSVPEPGSLALVVGGLAAVGGRVLARRRGHPRLSNARDFK